MINVNGLKRNAKNLVKKYSDAQIKVREATSNDPWGPSSTIMAEIADLTYNVMAFSEIMQMIWKRLNDHGKNWRHVYKALVVLEYLIKTGTEKVAQQCRENIFAIQTLKDFQYMEDNKDLGMNVREKSKALVSLLKDPEKLKSERARALKAKERFSESMSFMGRSGSQSNSDTPPHHSSGSLGFMDGSSVQSSSAIETATNSEIEQARPQTATEEETQLQLALAISKEEAEQQEKLRKHDDLRLKLALGVSQKEVSTNSSSVFGTNSSPSSSSSSSKGIKSGILTSPPSSVQTNNSSTTVDDLLGLNISQPEPFDLWKNNPPAPLPHPPVSSGSAVPDTLMSSTSDSLFWKSAPTTTAAPAVTQPDSNFDPWKTPTVTTTTPTTTTTMPFASTATTAISPPSMADTMFDAWKPMPSLPVVSSSNAPIAPTPMTRADDLNSFDPWSTPSASQSQQFDPWKPKPVSKNPFAD